MPALSPLWHDGRAWMPTIAMGFILRTQVHDVGAAILDKNVTNGDVYLVTLRRHRLRI